MTSFRTGIRLFGPVLIALGCALALCPSAQAWGCQGHEIIAYIAEAHLTPHARAMALKLFAASAINPALPRWCEPRATDPFADASTWADDYRSQHPETGPWHFIDIPRGAHHGSLAPYCPPATGCVVSALGAQIRVLKNPRASAKDRADALRFVIHLVGDMHQPLHDLTNDDLGGNCVPVEFFGRQPKETNSEYESFSPNLHWVWDLGIIDHFPASSPTVSRIIYVDQIPKLVASELTEHFRAKISLWESQPIDFAAWVWQSHALADSVAYGRLPHPIPVEAPKPVSSCADGNVGLHMLGYHEDLGAAYEAAAAPVVQLQLARAGARLAAVLNSIWP
ncbi:MAG TPA: S1/P1 nuclease [Candidatus Dormibacteraeota bacterium]|nr:S1/P1 nuclease [Candidatus Dormibacteraeota bacterium]